MKDSFLYTTLGLLGRDQLGMILPHEHVFVDLRTPDKPGYAQADVTEVVALMAPKIEEAKNCGVTAIVECSTTGVGRRADFDLAVSQATSFPLVVPTGSYREPWITEFVRNADDSALETWMYRELTQHLAESNYRAGWIKLSVGNDGITPLEERILRAAARASVRTGAVIGSHTQRGHVALEQIKILAEEGCSANRFIWIHTQNEKDLGFHDEAVSRGAWIEYDHVSRAPDHEVRALIVRALTAFKGRNLLVSQDVGWFDPAKPGGGTPRAYTYLSNVMMPLLQSAGVDQDTLKMLTQDNPFDAFSRPLSVI